MRRSLADIAGILGASQPTPFGTIVTGVAIDSRNVRPGDLFVALPGARVDGHSFIAEAERRGAVAFLVARGVTTTLPVVQVPDTLVALQTLARHERQHASFRLVAVTGSVGKTTTKEMLAALCATTYAIGVTHGNRNSEIGFPAELCNQGEGIAWMVAELGMSHRGELDRLGAIAKPDVVLYTNIAPVHLEFFPDLEGIAEAKAELIPHLRSDGILVLNAADPRVAGFAPRFSGRTVTYGVAGGSDLWIEGYSSQGLLGSRFALVGIGQRIHIELPLAGRHQADNFLAAATTALVLGVPPGAVEHCAKNLQPAPRRGEVHTLADGTTIVDDSYNASPEATKRLLELLVTSPGRRVAVLGEMLELGPDSLDLHREVGKVAGASADLVVTVGGPLAAELAAAVRHVPTSYVTNSGAALALLRQHIQSGDVVLIKGSRGIGLDVVVDGLLEGGGQ